MKNSVLVYLFFLIFAVFSCSGDNGVKVSTSTALVSERFLSSSEYEIVCIGLPKEGLIGIQKEASAKRAALLNVYYYVKGKFDDTVKPDQDGRIVTFTMYEDHGEIKYIVKKDKIKKRLRKE